MRILIIEDEATIASYIKKGLTQSGFSVDIAENGEVGLYLTSQHAYELIILDAMLPGRDGFSLLPDLKSALPTVAILFLTARGAIEDKVRGLEAGADDYLVKPFSFSELLARIRSLLRRSSPNSSTTLTIADLSIDLIKRKVTRANRAIELTAKEYALLLLLAQRSGEVLSRTLIAEYVWDINFDTDTNVVDVAIRRLRKKIDDPFPQKLIHTLRGIGYSLEDKSC